MSIDLAVWDGPTPEGRKAALAEYLRLMDEWQSTLPNAEPTEAIAAYVDALLARYPDIDTAAGADSPWADAPLRGNASGPILYFSMVYERADEGAAFAADLARAHGLVCFDPQSERLV